LSRWENLPGHEDEAAQLLLMRARVEAALLRFKDAEEYVQRALKLDYRVSGADPSPAKGEAYSVRAHIQREERYLSEARSSFESASRIYQQCEMYALAAENLKQAADIMIRLDEPIRAYTTLNQALELTKKRQVVVRE
jgi:tetratricopeptide (TPR) repeat protein